MKRMLSILLATVALCAEIETMPPTALSDNQETTVTTENLADKLREDFKEKNKNRTAIVIDKQGRELYFYKQGALVEGYPVPAVFGINEGCKERQGDLRTPEGEYFICTKNDKSEYSWFLGISYPNAEDAERGLQEGVITKKEADRIKKKLVEGSYDWYTGLGGEIGIHTIPHDLVGKVCATCKDWTYGCIAIPYDAMQDLFTQTKTRTPVLIIGESYQSSVSAPKTLCNQ
ncbi:MAG: L,D-transpeptidase [archaeon]